MQAQKQIHASQLWQQALHDVILKSCNTIVLRTLALVVQCKIFSWQVRKHETISTKKVVFLLVTLWIKLWETEHYLWRSLFALVHICSIKLSTILRIHLHNGIDELWIFYQEHSDTIQKNILITTNGKSRNVNHKNEMESNTFQQQQQYR